MRSTIAECHYDGNRNFIINLGGLRRWIIAPPSQCGSLYLYPPGHPSSRHSKVDWATATHPKILKKYPKLSNALMSEVILSPGEILYLPTGWFHYIVSLNINYQCNTRSGSTRKELRTLNKCGFP
jgi:ribosomal protein L16 Arg81 hydroxylase